MAGVVISQLAVLMHKRISSLLFVSAYLLEHGQSIERLQSLARPEPAAPFNTPIHVTAARFGSVRRCYVKRAKDLAVTPLLQEAMLARTPCDQVVTLNTSHTPFLAAPGGFGALADPPCQRVINQEGRQS